MEPSKQPPNSNEGGSPPKDGKGGSNNDGDDDTKMPPAGKEFRCNCHYCRNAQHVAPKEKESEDENDEIPNRSRTASGSSSESAEDPSSAAAPALFPGLANRPGIGRQQAGRRTPVGLPPNLMPSADRTSRQSLQLLQASARRRRRRRLHRERTSTPPPTPAVTQAESVIVCEVLPRVAEDEEVHNEENNASRQPGTLGNSAQETSADEIADEADERRSQRDQEEGVDELVDAARTVGSEGVSSEGGDFSADDGENTIGESTLDGDEEVPMATQVLVYATEEPSAPEAYAYLEFFHHHADESNNLYPDDEIAAAAAEAAAAVAVAVMGEASEDHALVEATAASLASEESRSDQEESNASRRRCVTPAISVRSSVTSAQIEEFVQVDVSGHGGVADNGEVGTANRGISERIPMEATVLTATTMEDEDENSEAASAIAVPYAVSRMSSNRYLSGLPEGDERSEHSKKHAASSVVDDASSIGGCSTRTDILRRFHRRQKRRCRKENSGRTGRSWLRTMLFSCRSGSAVDLSAYSPRVPSNHR